MKLVILSDKDAAEFARKHLGEGAGKKLISLLDKKSSTTRTWSAWLYLDPDGSQTSKPEEKWSPTRCTVPW